MVVFFLLLLCFDKITRNPFSFFSMPFVLEPLRAEFGSFGQHSIAGSLAHLSSSSHVYGARGGG